MLNFTVYPKFILFVDLKVITFRKKQKKERKKEIRGIELMNQKWLWCWN
jgi:hypothetical protein